MPGPDARTLRWAGLSIGAIATPLVAAAPPSLMGPEPPATEGSPSGAPDTDDGGTIESGAAPMSSQDMDAVGSETVTGENASPGMWDPDQLGGSNMLAGLLMAGGVLIIVFILMGRLKRNQRVMAASDATTAEQIAAIRARAEERTNIDAFKVDVHDFTRQMAALLDSKAERLEQLIADADERLARLDAAERGAPAVRPASTPAPPPTPRRPMPDLDAPVSVDPMHDRVYRLADSGLDAVAIARETGQPTGQVELILALRG